LFFGLDLLFADIGPKPLRLGLGQGQRARFHAAESRVDQAPHFLGVDVAEHGQHDVAGHDQMLLPLAEVGRGEPGDRVRPAQRFKR